MGRTPDPMQNIPDADRYRGEGNVAPNAAGENRYGPLRGKGDAGTYEWRATTLEEEASCGGWIAAARPTTTPCVQGNDPRIPRNANPINLFTIGMRGEPGFDDDNIPLQGQDGGYSKGTGGQDISSID